MILGKVRSISLTSSGPSTEATPSMVPINLPASLLISWYWMACWLKDSSRSRRLSRFAARSSSSFSSASPPPRDLFGARPLFSSAFPGEKIP